MRREIFKMGALGIALVLFGLLIGYCLFYLLALGLVWGLNELDITDMRNKVHVVALLLWITTFIINIIKKQ